MHSGRQAGCYRWSTGLAWLVALGATLGPLSAAANGDRLYIECPCTIESDGSTLSITAGIRSFRSTDSGALSLRVSDVDVSVTDGLASGDTLDTATYEIAIANRAFNSGQRDIGLALYEQVNDQPVEQDRVRMEAPVDLSGAFSVTDLDYLKDTDADGVGDVNERFEGTDPADAQSTPGSSMIDVLAMFSQPFAELYDGDPTTRIQHLVSLTNVIYLNSGVDIQLRLVGTLQVEFDEQSGSNHFDREFRQVEAHRHGADLMVLFDTPGSDVRFCSGRAPIGGLYERGHFDFEQERDNYSTLVGNCTATVLAHELGHQMGLGHSYWQGSVGTWRWSRGHGVDHDFGTIMSYGPPIGRGPWLEVFSDPQSVCVGLLEEAKPCGVDRDGVSGADSVTTLNAVRFQIAAFRDSRPDADADGYVDPVDAFPDDPADWWDADADGLGDNADKDDDNDGVLDDDDAFPLDGSETADADRDGVGDNADAFPQDPGETSDADGDGVGDNADVFPEDPLEWVDTDRDGVGDNSDPWPANPAENSDTDGDGTGDNADPDADGDGVLDELDAFPLDPAKWDLTSYLFTGEAPGDQAGQILSRAGNGDAASFLIGVPQHDVDGRENAGAVYLVSASDLATLDAADGNLDRLISLGHVVTGTNSWKFVGEDARDEAGRSLVSIGDMDGDRRADVLIGAPYHNTHTGAVYFVSGADFSAADAGDGEADHTIRLGQVALQPGSWKLVGETRYDEAGISVASIADTDGDGEAELLIGARGHNPGERASAGATYFLASVDFASADAADGVSDGLIDLGYVSGQPASWKLLGESAAAQSGFPVSAPGDIDADGQVEIAINAPRAVYLISVSDLVDADAADGRSDGVIELVHIAGQPNSWKLFGRLYTRWETQPVSVANDGIGPAVWLTLATSVLSTTVLPLTDAADGTQDGVVNLDRLTGPPGSWTMRTGSIVPVGDTDGDGGDNLLAATDLDRIRRGFLLSPSSLYALDAWRVRDGFVDGYDLNATLGVRTIFGPLPFAQIGVSTAGDVDGDGLSDILLGDPGPAVENRSGTVYLLTGDDLAALDRVDRSIDDRLFLGNVAGDTDADGVSNTFDRDDDGDGIPDGADAFQLDPMEWADSDRDGVGDNADAFPDDFFERFDTDGDGLGDFHADGDDDGDGIPDHDDDYPLDTDDDGTENRNDDDDDGDGVPDAEDALPLDPSESADNDGDGIGDNADTDDDNDGVVDGVDAFPLDPAETVDTDTDGVGDNADAFPTDPNESRDHDGDGLGNNADTDDDNDGVLDSEDRFPLDAGASNDSDGDGVADSSDVFPNDASESDDADGDGIGNNRDTDDDNDGVDDTYDVFPLDASRQDLTSIRVEMDVLASDFNRIEVSAAGDLDGDGRHDLLITAPDSEGQLVVYVVGLGDLTEADTADGLRDGSAHMRDVLAGMHSWKLVGEDGYIVGTVLSPFGDVTGDGFGEFYVVAGVSPEVLAGYIVSGADLLSADAADGTADGVIALAHVASQPASWQLRGYTGGGPVLTSVPADLDGDGSVEFAIGQPGTRAGNSPGSVHVISANTLPMLDALDGDIDGELALRQTEGHELWRLVGEAPRDGAGTSLTLTDFNADGQPDLIVGALFNDTKQQDEGAVYMLDSADLAAADLADGSADRRIELAHVADQPGSWKLVVDATNGNLGSGIASGDLDGDERQDFVVSSRHSANRPIQNLLSGLPESLPEIDLSDGAADGVVNLTGIQFPGNVQLDGSLRAILSGVDLTDFDGDGLDDIVMETGNNRVSMVAYLIASSALFGGHDIATASTVHIDNAFALGGSYQVYSPEAQSVNAAVAITAAGDVDADGLGDILLAVLQRASTGPAPPAGVAYLIMAADLPVLDAADGRIDGRIFLENVVQDRDRSPGGQSNMTDSSVPVTGTSCFVGLLLASGESCTYPGTEDSFSVNVRGRGRFLDRLAGIRIRINNEMINGRVYDFWATHTGDGEWRIDRVAGSTEPPTVDDSDGDGIPNDIDPDDDNDGTPDTDDPCPLDGSDACDDATSVASL